MLTPISNLMAEYFCFHKKFLLHNLVSRNIKLKYRKSYLGLFWTILAPVATAVVYFSVFRFIMKIQIENYAVYVLSGTMAWGFYSTAIVQGTESIFANHSLLSKIPIPVNIFPLTETTTLFVNFLFSLPVLLGASMITKVAFSWVWLVILPYLFILLFLQAYALGLIGSIGFIYFRDLRHLLGILFQILFYLNPIIYGIDMVPEKYHYLLYLLPTPFIFEGIHSIFAQGKFENWNGLIPSTLWTAFFILISIACLKRFKTRIVEMI